MNYVLNRIFSQTVCPYPLSYLMKQQKYQDAKTLKLYVLPDSQHVSENSYTIPLNHYLVLNFTIKIGN